MSTVTKIDLFKEHRAEYAAPRHPTLVEVGKARYLAIEGRGGLGSELFQACIGALYGAAFTITMSRKFAGEPHHVVCKLEGQYWTDDDTDPGSAPPEESRWRLMIRTPDFVTGGELTSAVAKLVEKGKGEKADEVELVTLDEGICVQMLHVGPYEREPETIEEMKRFAASEGYELAGRHHDVYLSDPRRVPPERLRTILRHPVRRVPG